MTMDERKTEELLALSSREYLEQLRRQKQPHHSRAGLCLDKMEFGEIDFQGEIIHGYLHFFQLKCHGPFDIHNMHVGENVYMREMHVGGNAILRELYVGGYIDLGDMLIEGTADFRELFVKSYADWRRLHIQKNADFRGMRIDGSADFMDLHVEGDADFRGASFKGNLSLYRLTIDGILRLEDVKIRSCAIRAGQFSIKGYSLNDNTYLSDDLQEALKAYERVSSMPLR